MVPIVCYSKSHCALQSQLRSQKFFCLCSNWPWWHSWKFWGTYASLKLICITIYIDGYIVLANSKYTNSMPMNMFQNKRAVVIVLCPSDHILDGECLVAWLELFFSQRCLRWMRNYCAKEAIIRPVLYLLLNVLCSHTLKWSTTFLTIKASVGCEGSSKLPDYSCHNWVKTASDFLPHVNLQTSQLSVSIGLF